MLRPGLRYDVKKNPVRMEQGEVSKAEREAFVVGRRLIAYPTWAPVIVAGISKQQERVWRKKCSVIRLPLGARAKV